MVKTNDDLQGMLIRLDRRFEKLDDDTILVGMGADQAPVALRMAHPVLVAQTRIGPAPKGDPAREAKLFRHLLGLNASDLFHAAYALEGDDIVLTAALELDSLDLNELEAVLADMGMAQSVHVPGLREMVGKK
ncbi:MAG: CesT family type III secretion system chaperone [Myxococcales bacterium]|nr:CesT family type III secretion system chaperone [Myxococcales bacterium]MCB9579163.1 CesT family type III secretion system chaperone [Polyangiaceae bacterium]